MLEHVYSEIRQAEGLLDLDHLDPTSAIRRIVEFTFTYYLEHEGFVRLVVAENQARGRHFRKSKAMRSLNRPIIDRLARVIARGQADGSFRADADPVEVHMVIAALGMFNVTNQYTFGSDLSARHGRQGRCPPAARAGRRGCARLPDEQRLTSSDVTRGKQAWTS